MIICTICARGGSKGVKNKNIRTIAGLPLITHTIRQAQKSQVFAAIAVSSDSQDILKVAREAGATHLIERPAELATDFAGKLPAIRHCVEEVEKRENCRFTTVVDLDATSPLRSVDDILACIRLFEQDPSANIVTGAKSRRSPYFNMLEAIPGSAHVKLVKTPDGLIKRRQDAPDCFDMNASIYVWSREDVNDDRVIKGNTKIHVMPEERSYDIDTEVDFRIVEFLLKESLAAQAHMPQN